MITKFFGQSSIQENFNKSDRLNWILHLNRFDYYEYIFGESLVHKTNISSQLTFDFSKSLLLMEGDIVGEAFQYRNKYEITNKSNQGLVPEYLLNDENNISNLKLTVNRKGKLPLNSNGYR